MKRNRGRRKVPGSTRTTGTKSTRKVGFGATSSTKRTGKTTGSNKRTAGTKKTTRGRKKTRGTGIGTRKTGKTTPGRKKRITEKRFDKHTFSNPFAKRKKYKTTFGQFYESGEIPCRVSHGGSMHRITLKWDKEIKGIPYNPYLVYFADGLRETEHPYVELASTGFQELLKAEGAKDKVVPIMAKIVPLIRMAFSTGGKEGFGRALEATNALSECVGDSLNDHLNSLLIQINKKSFDRKFSSKITEVLNTIEENSGQGVTKMIKSKVPTYSSIFM